MTRLDLLGLPGQAPSAVAARSRGSSWRIFFTVGLAFWIGCSTPYFEVDEAVRFEDGRTRFVAFAQKQRGWFLGGVSDVEVHFAVDGKEIATAVTDERGFAKAVAEVEQPADRFEAAAEFSGESFRRNAEVVAWRSDRVIVACDIDSTISQTSLGALFYDDLDATSTPIPDSPETLREVGRDHQLMYVTARPRFTLSKTRRWFEDHDGNVFRFQDWKQIGAFFRENHGVLSDPARLRAAIEGTETLRLPDSE